MQFELDRIRLTFSARDRIYFPPWKASNAFRGALGSALSASLFSPTGHSKQCGFSSPPRPFVIRASHLNDRTVETGQRFSIDLHIFNGDPEPFEAAFLAIAPLNGRAALAEAPLREHVSIPLDAWSRAVPWISVRFVAPTELKQDGQVAPQPDFPILFSRALSRLNALCRGYEKLGIDFRELARKACLIRLVSHALIHETVSRRSTRTGQTHPLGGFRGEATYEGDLRELVPYLKAAEWTGVGRQTVWGKGEIKITAGQT